MNRRPPSSLRRAIVLPFVVQIVLAVALTGFLAIRNGRRAAEEIGSRLLTEITERIEENLRHFLLAAHRIDETNRLVVEQGLLDPRDLASWRTYLWRQVRTSEPVNNIAVGNERGEYIGVDTPDSGKVVIQISNAETDYHLVTYDTDADGRLATVLSTTRDYDPRIRPWYRSPAEAGRPVWSGIYKHFVDPTLQMALSFPLQDRKGGLLAVATAAVRLSRISDFLKTLEIGRTGFAFIVDEAGFLVASSTPERPFFLMPDGTTKRLRVRKSENPLIRRLGEMILRDPDGPAAAGRGRHRRVDVDGGSHFVRVAPYRDAYGLDWRVVVVVPEADFMAGIDRSTLTTTLLCIAALVIAIGVGLRTSRRVTGPIRRLNRSARELAAGDRERRVAVDREDEIGQLARSFNEMARSLHESMETLESEVAERRAAEAELNRIFSMSIDLICIADLRSTAFVKINPAFTETLGFEAKELLGRPFLDLVHPEDMAATEAVVAEELRAGRKVIHFENRYRCKDGSYRWLSWVSHPDSERVVTYAIARDITGKKQAEAALRESEENYRGIFENAVEGFFQSTPEGRFISVNPSFARMFGYASPGELVSTITDIARQYYVDPEDRLRYKTLLREKGAVEHFEFQARRKDGAPIWVSNTTRARYDRDGVLVRYEGTVSDITARKEAEAERDRLEEQLRQAQKMEAVGRLAGGVAHDFNNNLMIILGQTEMAMISMDPDNALIQRLHEIDRAAQRSANLTRQLLAFARKQTIAPVVLNLNDTVSNLLKMLKRLIGEDIDLAWSPEADIWPVRMDPGQIDQILANLAVNARDAIAGVGKLTMETRNTVLDESYCRTHTGTVPGAYVMLVVGDDGCGMDRETLNRLFEPFFTTKPVGKGTGLGLATVYGIVKQNDGFVQVYSEPGKGTTFKIYLPRHEAESPTAPVPLPGEIPTGTETILLVEDDPGVMELAEMLLRELGYTVLSAGHPNRAIETAMDYDGEIHLLMTDVIMPEMSGRDLQERILGLRPGIGSLFMSGYTADVIAHQGILDPGVHFLQKPFSLEALGRKIRMVLDRNAGGEK